MQTEAQRIEATLTQLAAADADVREIADVACAVWCNITAALSPIIGQQGMAALYKRSLHLTRAQHPQLSAAYNDISELGDFITLREALLGQTSKNAAAASSALICTFYDLLSSLIGASLTERLLKSALNNSSTDNAASAPPP